MVFAGKAIPGRTNDTHDLVGTFELVSDRRFMHGGPVTWTDPDVFLAELQAANRQIMRGRPAKRPGELKTVANRAEATVFVHPTLVRGTLREGYALVRALEHPRPRRRAHVSDQRGAPL